MVDETRDGTEPPGTFTAAPDFSDEALQQLQVRCTVFCQHLREYIEHASRQRLGVLIDDLQRYRNTLVLLDKVGSVLVTEELLALLDECASGNLSVDDSIAIVLVKAGEQLSTHVDQLRAGARFDSALPLLPLINDCRACRGLPLMSAALLLAAGIDVNQSVSQQAHRSPDDAVEASQGVERQRLAEMLKAGRSMMMLQLLNWFRRPIELHEEQRRDADEDNLPELLALAQQFTRYAALCRSAGSLSALVPLFDSAAVMAGAIARHDLEDGPAPRRLFGQLERWLQKPAAGETVSQPPIELLGNLLYYVAQVTRPSTVADGLVRQFRLERIRHVERTSLPSIATGSGVSAPLVSAIRRNVDAETRLLRHWLTQARVTDEQPVLSELMARLADLEAVLKLLGAQAALDSLQHINRLLEDFPSSSDDEAVRLQLAEALLELDQALDAGRQPCVRGAAVDEPRSVSGTAFVDEATDACLRVARELLADAGAEFNSAATDGAAGALTQGRIQRQLRQLGEGLQVLPLPEVLPLFHGLSQLVPQTQAPWSDAHLEVLATAFVSLDYYLACVLQPQAAAGQLLQDADEAIGALLEVKLPRVAHDVASDDPVTDKTVRGVDPASRMGVRVAEPANTPGVRSVDPAGLTSVALQMMDDIGTALHQLKQPDADYRALWVRLVERFGVLQAAADVDGAEAMSRLCAASKHHLQWRLGSAEANGIERIDHEDQALVSEVHAVLPQLINQWQDGSGDVREFDALVDALADETQATASPVERSLAQVFADECRQHLDQLDQLLTQASGLPDELLLRTLHTLTGSAQTAGAEAIVAIVKPLQRVALSRHRLGLPFDRSEIDGIGVLAQALRDRLDALQQGVSVEPHLDTLDRLLPSMSGDDIRSSPQDELRSVFLDEARDLLQELQSLLGSDPVDADLIDRSLRLLHTLKGGARMTSMQALAAEAHQLEADVQSAQNADAALVSLQRGRASLQQLLHLSEHPVNDSDGAASVARALQVPAGDSTPAATGMAGLSDFPARQSVPANKVRRSALQPRPDDIAFDTVLGLATDVSVTQARLAEALTQLQGVSVDLAATADRWRHAFAGDEPLTSPARAEMVADIEAAGEALGVALRAADVEQQHASRSSAALQQNLIRGRLVRFDVVSDRLRTVLSDAAASSGKRAVLDIEGGEITLDRALSRTLLGPLEHLVRNAVVHGIETPELRQSIGKSLNGHIALTARVDGNDLVIELRDDGGGVDRAAVDNVLTSGGDAKILSADGLQSTLCRSGFSTRTDADQLAGRGLGLSSVDADVTDLGGQLLLTSESGVGMSVTLRVPQRIVVNQVVLVAQADALYAIPVNFVHAVSAESGDDEDQRYRRLPLSALQQSPGSEVAPKAGVLVDVRGELLHLLVDEVLGYRELIAQPLGLQMASLQLYSGGSVLADGRQVLILDLNRVQVPMASDAHHIGAGNGTVDDGEQGARYAPTDRASGDRHRQAMAAQPVALVVDDSMTLRTAATQMLSGYGVTSRLARDGLEALESIACHGLPDLFIVDLDMPRLNGFDLLRQLRQDHGKELPPVIIISSRERAAVHQRVSALGAVRFLPKPYGEREFRSALRASGISLPDLQIA